MEMSGQLHAPTVIIPENMPPYILDRGLGGSQSRPGLGGEEKNPFIFPAGNWIPVCQPVA